MLGKELQMEHSQYSLVSNRIWLLSNNLPPVELNDDDNNINAVLFLNNLSLKRKNNRLNKFNNKLHEQINSTRNHLLHKIQDNDDEGYLTSNISKASLSK